MATLDDFLRNNADMISAAGRCLELKQLIPALVLMYTHIDTLAWAAAWQTEVSVRERYEAWVKRWLLPRLSRHAPELTPTDLYAARCGLLHSLTSRSDLSEAGEARELVYAWKATAITTMRRDINDSASRGRLVGIYCGDLLDSLKQAVADFVEAAQGNVHMAASLAEAASRHYPNISKPESSSSP